ncbi:NosR/NirI family protein [Oceanibacterium hippocampi]|uniref:Putative electron transport protein YccM n=1 Tax=Oceanibacterium hippocampi TaxID=745714 RepID=A0A1Y5TIA9_9PROT|nr:NosR/NirI family protein [Oceanibacterium hippocampi]SLN60990.1 Putative electron transport protein YccM [Oceanibacterium hippocampi]
MTLSGILSGIRAGTLYRQATLLALILGLCVAGSTAIHAQSTPLLPKYIADLLPADLAAGGESFGPMRQDLPVMPILRGREIIAWAFLTSDFVGTTGYSGKPIHVVAAVSPDARLTGARLVKHAEPIVLIGIPNRKIQALTESYTGLDLAAEVAAGGDAHDLDIISGATVTIMVIDDSIVRSGIKVARALGLGGLAAGTEQPVVRRELDPAQDRVVDWQTLAGDGSIRRLALDVGQVNEAFAASGDELAAARPEPGNPSDLYIDLQAALVSVPTIGHSLLGDAEYDNLRTWLGEGDQAILLAGRGRYSFKGSGYVRGGIFDRVQLIQGDVAVRFRDRQHRRLGALAAGGAPSFTELDLFRIPAESGFDPAQPWRLQLLVNRAVGPVKKSFLTFDLDYRLPEPYLLPAAAPASATGNTAVVAPLVDADSEAAAKAALWQRIWRDRKIEIGALLLMLATLTGAFFFQLWFTRSERFVFWFRIGFLSVTLVFLGWYANAQLSVVNLLALVGTLRTGFTWDAFLLDPLVFILWGAVAAALLFWGRGAYCGWLCPFGALQELTNRLAKFLRIPQWHLPWGLHERLWPVKYIVFMALFGVSLMSIPAAEALAEVEPFKTAIILKFQRDWPFVLFAVGLLGIGLFVERFYCRYLCPLGAALAIPARIRMFDWLKRYHECGNPCQICAHECMVQAIHPTGEINPNECLNCMHCQVLYQHKGKCPVVIKKFKRLDALRDSTRASATARHPAPLPAAAQPSTKENGNV